MPGGGGDPAKYQKKEAAAQLKFEREQEAYYQENFAGLEGQIAQSGRYDVSQNINKALTQFEEAKGPYQQKAQEQQSRFLGGFGLPKDEQQRNRAMSQRQRNVLNDQKLFDATMEAGIRQGIRSGVASDTSMQRQNALNLGQGYQAEQVQAFQTNAALAANRDAYRQQQFQGQQAMIGAGISAISIGAGYFSGAPSPGGGGGGGGAMGQSFKYPTGVSGASNFAGGGTALGQPIQQIPSYKPPGF